MNYRELENEVAQQLQSGKMDIEIAVLPQVQAGFSQTINARIYVSYGGSKYEKPRSTDIIIQDEIVSVFVVLQSRFLETENGIYVLIEKVKQLLLGFRPVHTSALYLSTIEFDKYENNIWNYIVVFECRKVQAQQLQYSEESEAPLTSVSYNTVVNTI